MAYLSVQKLAAQWGVSSEHVQRLIRRGELHAVRIGHVWRIPPGAVEIYEARHANEPEAAPEMAPAVEAPRRATSVGGLELPADYQPVFGHLWVTDGPTKKTGSQRH